MLDEIRKEIQNFSGSEAKSILLHMTLRLQNILESKESQDNKLKEIQSLYNELIMLDQKDELDEYETIHLVCGESTAGSLRYSLGIYHNKIIGFPDFFATGPIKNLHEEEGFRKRHQWLKDNINFESDYLEEDYEPRFRKAIEEIINLPENLPIIIWTSENANEQIGLRFFLYLLRHHTNQIYIINTTLSYKELSDHDENQFSILHTGEVRPDRLREMYEQKRSNPLTVEERMIYQDEWLQLSKTDGLLRVWKENKIHTVQEDYFDLQIIDTVKKLRNEQKQNNYIKVATIIGELLGYVAGQIDDAFLEYRIRCLVYEGIFEMKGIPKGVRYYRVKLK